jgi:hypothetical protein
MRATSSCIRSSRTARALDAYQQHPLHVEVKKVIGPLLTARHALDWDA